MPPLLPLELQTQHMWAGAPGVSVQEQQAHDILLQEALQELLAGNAGGAGVRRVSAGAVAQRRTAGGPNLTWTDSFSPVGHAGRLPVAWLQADS